MLQALYSLSLLIHFCALLILVLVPRKLFTEVSLVKQASERSPIVLDLHCDQRTLRFLSYVVKILSRLTLPVRLPIASVKFLHMLFAKL